MNRWLKLAFLVVAAVAVAEIVLRDQDRKAGPPAAADDVEAATAPEAPALTLPTLDGRTVDLRSLRGRVVAVNFWATWCQPCRQELPDLVDIWKTRHGKCFDLLGVAGSSARVDTEKMAQEIPYPVLFDADGTAVDAWDVRGFPRTYVLDAAGRVRRVFRGLVDKEELTGAIDPLLPRSCPARGG
jgi:cytochrome c biogenesis protein CcmG, thiol:disulfide interchange protein DsbE